MKIQYLRPQQLTTNDREEIWRFFSRYVRRERSTFEAKLGKVDEVFLCRNQAGQISAFGAVELVEGNCGGPYAALVSHWAAFDPEARGTSIPHQLGLHYYVRYRLRHPLTPIYWLFTASTYKSYLLMSRNSSTYWPRPEASWPARERVIVDDVMRKTGEVNWDRETGVIRRFGASRYLEGVVADEPAALRDPQVRYYARMNPGQIHGDTLACLCPLSFDNWITIAKSAWRRTMRKLRGSAAPARTAVTSIPRPPVSRIPPPNTPPPRPSQIPQFTSQNFSTSSLGGRTHSITPRTTYSRPGVNG